MLTKNIKIGFFGTPNVAVFVLEELKTSGILPSLIVTSPDKPKGRKLLITPPPVKVWAEKHKIPVIQPTLLKDFSSEKIISEIKWDIFIVAAYGKLIPKEIFELPKFGTINMHPSLLPKLRGPSPIQTSILTENETGVTIIKIDEQMDHGPILLQEKVSIPNWPPKAGELEERLSRHGGRMIAKIIPGIIDGNIKMVEQDHKKATFTKKIEKKDALIDLKEEDWENYKKIQAFEQWPRAYFLADKKGQNVRIIITAATFEGGKLLIKKVIPEGKKEMDYEIFSRNLKN